MNQEKRKFKNVEFKLPTIEQWTYASKGGLDLSPFPWEGSSMQNKRGEWLANFMVIPQNCIGYDILLVQNVYGKIENKKIHMVCETYELLLAPLSPAFAGGCDARPSNSTGSSPSAAAAPDSRLGASDGILEEEELPAATGADIVFSCVGNDDDLRAVTLGADGAFAGMAPGAVLVDHTTASADVARELYGAAKNLGLAFVDAPVSGGQAGAQNGLLTVMCGGDVEPFAAMQPVALALLAFVARVRSAAGLILFGVAISAFAGALTSLVFNFSPSPVTTRFPSGLNATPQIGALWLTPTNTFLPVRGSQTRRRLSAAPEAINFPSGLNAIHLTASVWPS